jgi:hypothetical protein
VLFDPEPQWLGQRKTNENMQSSIAITLTLPRWLSSDEGGGLHLAGLRNRFQTAIVSFCHFSLRFIRLLSVE